jgi:hypothetical protein
MFLDYPASFPLAVSGLTIARAGNSAAASGNDSQPLAANAAR